MIHRKIPVLDPVKNGLFGYVENGGYVSDSQLQGVPSSGSFLNSAHYFPDRLPCQEKCGYCPIRLVNKPVGTGSVQLNHRLVWAWF
jgi:hypothetical protein